MPKATITIPADLVSRVAGNVLSILREDPDHWHHVREDDFWELLDQLEAANEGDGAPMTVEYAALRFVLRDSLEDAGGDVHGLAESTFSLSEIRPATARVNWLADTIAELYLAEMLRGVELCETFLVDLA